MNLYQLAIRISTDFASAVFVSGIIGYMIDRFFGCQPWAFIVFVFLGIIAGGRIVYRALKLGHYKVKDINDDGSTPSI